MSSSGRILALDVGTKRIGLALSDELRITGQPYDTLEPESHDDALDKMEVIIQKENVTLVVVGMPRRLDGSSSEMTDEAKTLASKIRERFKITVRMWDERYSTHAAQRALLEGDVSRKKRKQVIDKTAAAWILQGFLDSGRA